MEKTTIEVPLELFDALQKIKEISYQVSGQRVEGDGDVIAILIGGFFDSLNDEPGYKK